MGENYPLAINRKEKNKINYIHTKSGMKLLFNQYESLWRLIYYKINKNDSKGNNYKIHILEIIISTTFKSKYV